jgi:hypothetical protein
MPQGTPLISPVAGTLTDRENPGGFGHYQTVVPDAAPSETFILGHESVWKAKSGHVAPNTVVGLSGSTGNSTGPHLHFEQDIGGPPYAAGNDVNPMAALTSGAPASTISTAAAKTANPCDGKTGLDYWNCVVSTSLSQDAGVWNGVKQAVTDPVGTFFTDLSTIFTQDHLLRAGMIIGGVITILIGLAVLARVPQQLPSALQGAAAMTPEGAVAETAAAA